jgi:2OG-Fe(II) oxygenase superfamily
LEAPPAWLAGGEHPAAHITLGSDEPDTLVSRILYLNRRWDPAWGGCLRLPDRTDRAPVVDVPPTAGTSVVIVRSSDWWDEVAPLGSPGLLTRLSVWVPLHVPGFRPKPGRRP